MVEIGNRNIMTTRVDPARQERVKKTRKRKEGDSAYLRRAIDALAEKEGVE